MKLRLKFLILLILITSVYLVPHTSAEAKLENRIIIFDEGHLQHYNYSDFMSAMSMLNTTFDTNSKNYEFEVIVNRGSFNSSNLQGADLLIISNPGVNEDGSDNVIDTEKAAINSLVKNGGGILYMSNPITDNAKLSGHAVPLDALMADGFNAEVLKGRDNVDFDNTSIIIDDFHNDGNFSHVYFTSEFIKSDILRSELNNVSRILYYGAAIQDGNPEIYGNTTYQAYTVDNRFDVVAAQLGQTKWMSGKDIGEEGGRALIIGSSIMFTNSSYDESTTWIDVEDHRALFENILAWLANITPLNKPIETVNETFGSLIAKNLFAAILITVGLIALSFILLIRKNAITTSRIFEFKVSKKGSTKSEKGQKVETKDSKTTKKPTKSRRKRN